MEKSYLTTGEFAKLCNTSKHTLFHYCDIGLFSPVFIDENGYRYYHVLQYDLFLTIRQLHLIGMPLEQIKRYVARRTPENMLELYRAQEKRLNQQIAQLKQIRSSLHTQRIGMEQALTCGDGQYFMEKRACQPLFCSRTISELDDYIMTAEIGALIASAEDARHPSTLGMVCDLREAVQEEHGPFRFYLYAGKRRADDGVTIPSGQYLCTYHRGAYQTLYQTYRSLYRHAVCQNIALSGMIYAETVIGDWAVRNPDEYVIKVFVHIDEKTERIS